MRSFRFCYFPLVALFFSICLHSQTLQRRPAEPAQSPSESKRTASIPLVVPAGTPIKVAIDKDVKIHRAGQPIQGKTVEPIYAFDKLLIPAGTEVKGRIAAIED